MEAFGRNDYNTNYVTQCVGSSIKNHSPSGSLFRSFIRSRLFTVDYQHDILVRELKRHGLVVINNLMRQMICQYISFDFFLCSVLDVIFGQDHLSSGYSSEESWLLEDVIDRIHLRNQ